MKYLLLTPLLFVQVSSACQLAIPESYIPIFLSPPVSGAYKTCELDKNEPCHCVDKIDPWTSELIDNEVIDYISKVEEVACESELDCDDKFEKIKCKDGEKINNYESLSVYCAVPVMKIDGKKLVENKAKKASHEAVKADKEAKELTKKDKKKAARKALKEADLDGANSIAKLKVIVKALLEAQE